MPTLPLYAHEVLAAALLYTFVHIVVSPWVSETWFSAYYPRTSRGKKANWDSQVVSLFQSVLVNGLALWVMYADSDRARMGSSWEGRVWGYTGADALVQSFAAGYFVWDLVVTVLYLDVFGLGLLAHASSALVVFSLGYVCFFSSFSLYRVYLTNSL